MVFPPVITVFRGFPGAGIYTWSPFVTKLEARLRFANIPYRVEAGSMPKAPRGKVPYMTVDDGSAPQTLADSALITNALIQNGWIDDLNDQLSPVEKLQDVALKALLEDKLYPYQVYERWVLNYYTMRSTILAALPWPIQTLVGLLVYRKVIRKLQGQGTLTFKDEEIAFFRQDIWKHINGLVAVAHAKHASRKGPFWVWGGSAPTEVDAVLFGFIASGLVCNAYVSRPSSCRLRCADCCSAPVSREIIQGYPALVDYARRIHDEYFPDYELWER